MKLYQIHRQNYFMHILFLLDGCSTISSRIQLQWKREIKSKIVELVTNLVTKKWGSLYFIEINPILTLHQSIRFN